MRKLYFIISAIISIVGGKALALVMFDSPRDPGGASMRAACIVLVFAIFGVIYQPLRDKYREAAAIRLARYEYRRTKKLEEIDAKNFIRNYELLRSDFLEGREDQ